MQRVETRFPLSASAPSRRGLRRRSASALVVHGRFVFRCVAPASARVCSAKRSARLDERADFMEKVDKALYYKCAAHHTATRKEAQREQACDRSLCLLSCSARAFDSSSAFLALLPCFDRRLDAVKEQAVLDVLAMEKMIAAEKKLQQ